MDAKWCEECGSRYVGDECPNCAEAEKAPKEDKE